VDDTAWLGSCLCVGIACLGAYVILDCGAIAPDRPALAGDPAHALVVVAIVLFRIALSEQPTGAIALMTVAGHYQRPDARTLRLVTLGTALDLARSWRPWRYAACDRRCSRRGLIVVASLMDADSTSLTRPHDIVVSQALIAIATAMFLGPRSCSGCCRCPGRLSQHRELLAMFSAAQNMGSCSGRPGSAPTSPISSACTSRGWSSRSASPIPRSVVRAAQASAAQAGIVLDPQLRAALGVASLAQQVAREAWALAYGDLFRRVAVVAALTFVGWRCTGACSGGASARRHCSLLP
jgi:hypothetical protein